MIRPADLSDAADIAAIYNEYIAGSTATFDTDPVSVTEMQGRIAEISAAFPYLVCETGGKVISRNEVRPVAGRRGLSVALIGTRGGVSQESY